MARTLPRDVYLNIWRDPGEEKVDIEDLPDAAGLDSPQEKAKIAELFDKYNNSDDLDISPEMDGGICRNRPGKEPGGNRFEPTSRYPSSAP